MDLTDAYENGAYIPDGAAYPARWQAQAEAFRASLGDRFRTMPYGETDREALDLMLPDARPSGLLIFIHGGYWRRFDKSLWSHLAAGPLARSWAVAMPSYTLAPEARIARITAQAARAVVTAAGTCAGPIVVCGHSAGGHLSARMRCRDVTLPGDVASRIKRIVPISPVSDLRPLMQTDMNTDLRIEAEEAQAESPALCTDLRDIDTHVWVGGAERPAFLDQARWLAEAWPQTTLTVREGRHHFDVISEMEGADGALTGALLDGL